MFSIPSLLTNLIRCTLLQRFAKIIKREQGHDTVSIISMHIILLDTKHDYSVTLFSRVITVTAYSWYVSVTSVSALIVSEHSGE